MKALSLSRSRPLRTFALAIAFSAAALPSLPAAAQEPAGAPVPAKAYAPERLWELPEADQRRVIDLEYRERSGGRGIPDDQMRFYLDQVRFSRWTFSRIQQDIAESLQGQGISDPQSAGTLRCESTDGRQRTCRTPWSGGSQLVRQLSSTLCVERSNWSAAQGEIRVWGGCRGEFAPLDTASADEIRCESTNNGQRACPTPWRGESRLVRQLSGRPCIEGQSWWSNPGQVVVVNGCRATFAMAYEQAGGEVRCESTDGRMRTCPTPWRLESRLLRQLSSTPCVAGRNWWSRRGEVQVSGGCRAVFVATHDGGGIGQEIRCESTDGGYRQCGSGLYGTPVLVRQLSDTPCTPERSYGLRNGALWVSGGCRGVFRVQDGGQPGYDDGYSVTCASENGRYRACSWDASRGPPRLIRTLSDTACRQGESWGWTRRDGLWVNHGCRGVFSP
jgi:hypothetical protein